MGQREEWLRQLESMRHGGAAGAALAMRGRIRLRLKDKHWFKFTAREIIIAERGFVWSAEVSVGALKIHGWDGCIEGQGASEWQALGLMTVARHAGDDVSRSARGRLAIAGVFVPNWLAQARKREPGEMWTCAAAGHRVDLQYWTGQLRQASVTRWGNPDGYWKEQPFGVEILATETFGGVHVPASIKAGWWIGTPRWEQGQFIQAEVTHAEVW